MTDPLSSAAIKPSTLVEAFLATPRLAFRRCSRLLASAGVALLLTATAHTLGHFAPAPPNSPAETITEEMAAIRLPMGMGMNPSVLDIFNGFSLMLSVLVLWAGLSTLAVAAHGSPQDRRRRAWSGLALSAALVLLSWHFQLPPTLISFGVVTLLFGGAALLAFDRG
jgi:hypothetical protein